ncbi:DUF4340 domain-containing protein [Planctomycetota bacterium]
MSNKKLAILVVIAVVMLIWATIQSRVSNMSVTVSPGQTYLLQGFNPSNIDSIVISTPDSNEIVTLKRNSDGFVVVNKENYPAVTTEINDLINQCLEIKTAQLVTRDPANHEDLEITEEKAVYVIKFLKDDSTLLTGIIVGKTKDIGEGTYIRLASSDEVYITSDAPWFKTTALDYIKQDLMSLLRADIESVKVSSSDGDYTLTVNEESTPVLDNVPDGREAIISECEIVFAALTSLNCEDVMKNHGGLVFDSTYVCRLKNTTVFTLSIARDDDKAYVICEADFEDRTPVTVGDIEESEEELKKKEEKLLAWEKAEAYSEKHKGWIYQIPSYKADNMTKPLADLIKDIEEPDVDELNEDTNSIESDISSADDIPAASIENEITPTDEIFSATEQ